MAVRFAAEWLRLGVLMDFVPPVTLSPGPKSTYTRVREAIATSDAPLNTPEFR
jgi:hypothetical protein